MLPHRFRSVSTAAVLLGTMLLSACAGDSSNNDPYESVNRKIWDVDLALNDYLLTPIAKGYRTVTPEFAQTAITNALRNLKGPAILANDLLEGNTKRAGQTMTRIVLNTTVGIGGLIDVAATQNLPYHEADFGATLGAWGIPAGPYLVLPLLGPSGPRDSIGVAVDTYLDPFNVKTRASGNDNAGYIREGIQVIETEARTLDDFNELRKSSLDFYAAIRSLYQQKRAADIATAKNPEAPALPSVPYDEVEPSSPVPTNPPAAAGPAKAQ
jgi:phospholipid-binding lipoprotein MlaA